MSDIQAMSQAQLQALSPLVNSVHMNAEDDESISPILQPTLKRKTNRNYKDLHNRYVCTPMYPLYDTMVNMKIKREKRKIFRNVTFLLAILYLKKIYIIT